jgi:hypothetical protein
MPLSPTGMGLPFVQGRGAASPAAPPARQSIVADTSRTTRSADQQSGPLHDRPAVNGWASAPGVRCRPPRQRWSRHHRTLRRRSAGPARPAGQAPPAFYRTRTVAPTSSECPPHRRCADLPLSGDAPARPPGWEPGNRLCALLPRYSERPSRRSCGRVHTMRTISPWQSAAHDPAGDGIRNAGGRGTRRLAADWCFTGLRDPRAPPRGASPAQRAIDDSPTFRSATLPSSSCPP